MRHDLLVVGKYPNRDGTYCFAAQKNLALKELSYISPEIFYGVLSKICLDLKEEMDYQEVPVENFKWYFYPSEV